MQKPPFGGKCAPRPGCGSRPDPAAATSSAAPHSRAAESHGPFGGIRRDSRHSFFRSDGKPAARNKVSVDGAVAATIAFPRFGNTTTILLSLSARIESLKQLGTASREVTSLYSKFQPLFVV